MILIIVFSTITPSFGSTINPEIKTNENISNELMLNSNECITFSGLYYDSRLFQLNKIDDYDEKITHILNQVKIVKIDADVESIQNIINSTSSVFYIAINTDRERSEINKLINIAIEQSNINENVKGILFNVNWDPESKSQKKDILIKDLEKLINQIEDQVERTTKIGISAPLEFWLNSGINMDLLDHIQIYWKLSLENEDNFEYVKAITNSIKSFEQRYNQEVSVEFFFPNSNINLEDFSSSINSISRDFVRDFLTTLNGHEISYFISTINEDILFNCYPKQNLEIKYEKILNSDSFIFRTTQKHTITSDSALFVTFELTGYPSNFIIRGYNNDTVFLEQSATEDVNFLIEVDKKIKVNEIIFEIEWDKKLSKSNFSHIPFFSLPILLENEPILVEGNFQIVPKNSIACSNDAGCYLGNAHQLITNEPWEEFVREIVNFFETLLYNMFSDIKIDIVSLGIALVFSIIGGIVSIYLYSKFCRILAHRN